MLSVKSIIFAALLTFLMADISVQAQGYSIGVYYFPGWTEAPDEWWNPPWEKIKPYPDREPLLGWYPEAEIRIAEKHINWMHDYGIDFIVYNWYWSGNKVKLDHALQTYSKARNNHLVKFSILWANHSQVPENLSQFTGMVDFWITSYFKNKQFMLIDGKPVVYIFSPEQLRDNARKFGKSTRALLDISRDMAKKAGFKGIYYVACTQASDYWVKSFIPESGYDAMSAYNYHRGYSGFYEKGGLSTKFSELAAGYKQSWSWILNNSQLPYFVPVSAGWSKKPWGSHTPHDESISNPTSFRKHLVDAKDIIDRYPDKTMKTVVICAWNEFGEGSYIEPTKKWQFQYLQAIKDVFNK